jgi:hypothetical protein
MDFTPGEKAVLSQIRLLYAASARPDQQMKALTMQWTPTHYETYRKAYGALTAKALIHDTGGQAFTITDAGLRAMGVTPRPQAEPVRVAHVRPVPQQPPRAQPPRARFLRRAVGLLRGRA